MTRAWLLVVLLGCFTFGWTLETAPKVKTPLGCIKGYCKLSANGRQYQAYEGIPYALPPIGKLRFKKLTLVGFSAGGASVHYHYLSPMSAGLFQAGISVSGTSFNSWPQTENALGKAQEVAALMGCPTANKMEMIHCLRFQPSRSLVASTKEFQKFYFNPFTPFGPVVEKAGDEPFIDRPPIEIVNCGDVQDVSWLTSVTSEEGLYPVAVERRSLGRN
ncbi:carboxylic ester hydrolase-like isoform X2 [Lasioglossum baleicum]|uniref:carboxylic ester hydrolase-like isoform X2 n=1 Tax=Lasioglossum baleicum TaxID=434251 RepID=UPI003FCD2C31